MYCSSNVEVLNASLNYFRGICLSPQIRLFVEEKESFMVYLRQNSVLGLQRARVSTLSPPDYTSRGVEAILSHTVHNETLFAYDLIRTVTLSDQKSVWKLARHLYIFFRIL